MNFLGISTCQAACKGPSLQQFYKVDVMMPASQIGKLRDTEVRSKLKTLEVLKLDSRPCIWNIKECSLSPQIVMPLSPMAQGCEILSDGSLETSLL
jgi:hypothetical protein